MNGNNNSATVRYTATCLFGLEGLLGSEIDKMGYKRCETMDGRITFEGPLSAAAVCNINFRFAERLYLNLAEFECRTFDQLFCGVREIAFEDWIGKNDAFPVRGHSIKSTLFSVPDCQRIIKKAAATRLGKAYGLSVLPESGTKYQLDFFLFKDRASIMIDLSGVPLHKRGYRPETVAAPLRETLAAAMVALSRPRPGVVLRDPFCGSGTIVIEGAMMMKNIAPGVSRRFAAEEFPAFGPHIWSEARDSAISAVTDGGGFITVGSDIDPQCVRIAAESAVRAGVSDVASFYCDDALKLETGGLRGTVVTNPPYGERLMSDTGADSLYRDMGKCWQRLGRWQIYVLTSHEGFQQLYGRRADKVRKLYNGMIPCYYYQFFKNK